MESPIFEEWRDSQDQGILWIRGIPGAGKSVHAANLIHYLSKDGCEMLYFFFRHTIEANHRPEAALRDWLAQALPFSPALQLDLKDKTSEPVHMLTISDLTRLLRLALGGTSKTYCVVDALDEMDQTMLEPFLHIIDELGHWRPAEIKFIITSRPVAIVERIVRNIQLLDVRLDKELVEPDIFVYLWHRVRQSCLLSDSHSAVVEYILGKSDGLFLYAKPAMDAISHLEDDVEVQQILNGLPMDLTDMYANLLREHLERTGIAPELQILILKCVTHAIRPLRLLEISDCITVTQPQYGSDSGKMKALVRSACGPLLEVLPEETVRVVHYSLTEYLLGIIQPAGNFTAPFAVFESGPTHGQIAMLCLTYLQLVGLAQLKIKEGFHTEAYIEKGIYTPFTKYALANWHTHVKRASAFGLEMGPLNEHLHRLFVESVNNQARKLCLSANLSEKNDGRSSGQPPRPRAFALRLAIGLKLLFFVENLLERYGKELTNYDPDLDYCPLIYAVKSADCGVVRSLISHGADVNEYDTHGLTPLHTAVGSRYYDLGQPIMAAILLDAGADPEKDRGKDQYVWDNTIGGRDKIPACKTAFEIGNREMAFVFMPYVKGATQASRALAWAVGSNSAGTLDVIDVILAHPELDINAKHKDFGLTPLYQACELRNSAVIRKLLSAGADPNILCVGSTGLARNVGCNVLHALANRGPEWSATMQINPSEEETRQCFRMVIAAGANGMPYHFLFA